MHNLMTEIVESARTDNLSLCEMFLKLTEEVGELATAILVEEGAINKTIDEDSMHEAADVMIMVLCVLMKSKGEQWDAADVVNELHDAMTTKLGKYYELLNNPSESQ